MEQFPHLKFIQKLTGKPRFQGGGRPNSQSQYNRDHRGEHSSNLKRWTVATQTEWNSSFDEREANNLAPLSGEIVPIFIKVNPDIINAEFDLESFGIELISEEEEGFIIGASLDNLRTLEDKIEGFISAQWGSGLIADFWQIYEGNREEWKPAHILSEGLFSKWHEIQDEETYKVEVSIAFAKSIGKEPDPTKQGGQRRLAEYRRKSEERDDLLMQREDHFQRFINNYGQITSNIIQLEDSFGCEVSISGKGLKDLVVNYQFVFEVVEIEEISGIDGVDGGFPEIEVETLAPEIGAPEVGVIDSGIMEGNRYISDAINIRASKSYLVSNSSTADYVRGGGHGTKVAGAILYPEGVSAVSFPYQLPCLIRNLRVLDENNRLVHKYPAELMQEIQSDNLDCKIFNLSISSNGAFRTRHMSTWATMIDKLVFENDALFLVATGNIKFQDIKHYLTSRSGYPDYLNQPFCRLANPAQSSFAITVGSVNHTSFEDVNWKSIGDVDEVSAYSRIGMGIWGHIKPDVVEYGGGVVVSKDGLNQVKEHPETAIELIRSTLHGGGAFGKDSVGTSFSTPKVAFIAAMLKKLYPDEGVNLIRALIAQGARLPGNHFAIPSTRSIQHFGYGLPSLERVTKNTDHRVTFYNAAKIEAEECHIYSLSIPEELRGPGDEFDILIEITLAYTAKVRRTRQKTKSYLSTWLDWDTSKIGESFDDFKDYILKEIEGTVTSYDSEMREGLESFQWKINNRTNRGDVMGFSRNNSTLQKDWAILKSYDLPEELSIAIRGHKGWDKNKEEVPYAVTVSIEILGSNIPIYETIKIENQIEVEV